MLQKKTKSILMNIFSGNSQKSGLMFKKPVETKGFITRSSQFRLQLQISVAPGESPKWPLLESLLRECYKDLITPVLNLYLP